jgi:sugar lactone lactonase YvrE
VTTARGGRCICSASPQRREATASAQPIASPGACSACCGDAGFSGADIATGAVTTLASLVTSDSGAATMFGSFGGLAIGGDGDLYVVGGNAIWKVVILTGVTSVVAGSPGAFGTADGTGVAALFNAPTGLTIDEAGNTLYVADSGNATIRQVAISTGVVTTLAGSADVPGNVDGSGSAALFGRPGPMALDGAGDLYVVDADFGFCGIRKVVVATGVVTTLATSSWGSSGCPEGLAVDGGVETLYVADEFNDTIQQIAVGTGAVTTLAGSPQSYALEDGTGTSAGTAYARGLAVDEAGNLYLAESLAIRRVAVATGVVTTLAGGGGSGNVDGVGAAATFSFANGLASDGSGNLYVTDSFENTIRQVVIATGAVTTLAGTPQISGDADGTGAAALFNHPQGIAADGGGNLYVADTFNHTIRQVVTATGAVTTLAGSPGAAGEVDGVGAAADFAFPAGLAIDHAGNLYVTSEYGVRKLVLATGAVTTLAGGGSDSYGRADGIAAAAQFGSAASLVADDQGNLYIADTPNDTIRKLEIATRAVTTVLGVAGRDGDVLGPVPAGLDQPQGLAIGSDGALFISTPNAILVAR